LKLPRDLGSDDLIMALKKFGYERTRTSGSHIRLTTKVNGEHHITIPQSKSLRVGTLSHIVGDIAVHFDMNKDIFIEALLNR
jgi:predicted RNA binding protein YcfA (HicA-like mRNA interferase family)